MYLRRTIFIPFAIFLMSLASGCGQDSVTTPQPGELSKYLEKNPDSPKSRTEDPAGINGPGSIGQ